MISKMETKRNSRFLHSTSNLYSHSFAWLYHRNPSASPSPFSVSFFFFSFLPPRLVLSLLVFGYPYLCQIRDRRDGRGRERERAASAGLIEKMRHLSWPTSFSPGVSSREWNFLQRDPETSGEITRRRGIVINGVRAPWLVLPQSYPSIRSELFDHAYSSQVECNRGGWARYVTETAGNPSLQRRLIVIATAWHGGKNPIGNGTDKPGFLHGRCIRASSAAVDEFWRPPGLWPTIDRSQFERRGLFCAGHFCGHFGCVRLRPFHAWHFHLSLVYCGNLQLGLVCSFIRGTLISEWYIADIFS